MNRLKILLTTLAALFITTSVHQLPASKATYKSENIIVLLDKKAQTLTSTVTATGKTKCLYNTGAKKIGAVNFTNTDQLIVTDTNGKILLCQQIHRIINSDRFLF